MQRATIIGAGLVGSLLSIYLSRHGFEVNVYERRKDPRNGDKEKGRSINLALSDRGIRGLIGASKSLAEEVISKAIPMQGRMVHDEEGKVSLHPYGKEDQFIYSISRADLNETLISFSEKEGNVKYHFDHRSTDYDFDKDSIVFNNSSGEEKRIESSDVVIGADGAFSSLRNAIQKTDLFNYSQFYLEYGYKELTIPATNQGEFQLFKNALHIWPRKSFMLIALPNLDGSFTCTLFLPFKGENSFETLKDADAIEMFFEKNFKDAQVLIKNLPQTFATNPTSSLVTIKCFPWSFKEKYLLIGDAAHAIVPFYGQGMNAGFEDCVVLNDLLDKEKDIKQVLQNFQLTRKEDTDAISELAFRNFVEMRDLVIDDRFLLRKKIEGKLHKLYPKDWIPLYTMVTFSDMRYSKALKLGKLQDEIMAEVLDISGIETSWENLDFEAVIKKFKTVQKLI